jgi:hypothetical protein
VEAVLGAQFSPRTAFHFDALAETMAASVELVANDAAVEPRFITSGARRFDRYKRRGGDLISAVRPRMPDVCQTYSPSASTKAAQPLAQ